LDHVELFDEDGNPMSRDDLKADAALENATEESSDESVDAVTENEENE
jgi:hypothetical protein